MLGGVAAAAALVGTIWYAVDEDHRSTAQAVSISGAVVSLFAGHESGRAAEHLQLSIWHYNRTLPASVP